MRDEVNERFRINIIVGNPLPWYIWMFFGPLNPPIKAIHEQTSMPQLLHKCPQMLWDVTVFLPLLAFHNKIPCICPDSPMLLTCCSLSLGNRPTHRFRVSMIWPVCCSFACVAWKCNRVSVMINTQSSLVQLPDTYLNAALVRYIWRSWQSMTRSHRSGARFQ